MTGRLPPFLAISLLIHGLALAMLAVGVRDSTGRQPGSQWLPITLAQPATSTGQRIQATVSATKQARAPHADTSQISSHVNEDKVDTTNTSSQPDIEARGKRLQVALHHALLPHFYYPLLARTQGWQGEAHFAVHVAANGQLSQLHLMRSSGYAVLDRAAQDSLGRIHRLPEALHHHLGNQGMTLRIPVVYKLTEG